PLPIYPYIFPANKEIPDKIPTLSLANFAEIDGGPYPSSSQGPIHTFSDAATLVKGRHTIKGGVVVEYSGEDDFDQINVQAIPGSTNNQNGRFEFLDNRAAGTGLAVANAAIVDPVTGRITGGNRYNGIVLPGSGFEGDGSSLVVAGDPAVLALFRNEPVGFSKTHLNALEPRAGMAYSLNDKTVLRGSAGV